MTIVTAVFTIILFNDTDETPQGVQNRNGALFFMTMTIAFNAVQSIILIFPDERPVFLREVNNNMYSVSPYFFAKVVSELPPSILTPVIYGSIVYFSIGLSTEHAYTFPVHCNIYIHFLFDSFSDYIDSYLWHRWILLTHSFSHFLW